MPRSKTPRTAPGSARREESPLGFPETPPRGDSRDSRSTPGRRSESRPVRDGGVTRRRGAGAGPAHTPSAVPPPIENDTDSPDADLWR